MMGVVWDNSSDVICICVRNSHNGNVITMLSPRFLKICTSLKTNGRNEHQDHGQDLEAITFEIDSKFLKKAQEKEASTTYLSDLDYDDVSPKIMHVDNITDFMNHSESQGTATLFSSGASGHTNGIRNRRKSLEMIVKDEPIRDQITSMARLVVRAWNTNKDVNVIMHELMRTNDAPHDNGYQHQDMVNIRFEAKLTKMGDNSMLIVARDISERLRRFEAEKKVISETTARRKDAAANRFTRHEVKNGLLAAIGLCDSLREAEDKYKLRRASRSQESLLEDLKSYRLHQGSPVNTSNSTKRHLFELNKTLHEILDTVLAEAMARDVIHGIYEPKLERVDVTELLCSTISVLENGDTDSYGMGRDNKRFPITTVPPSLPKYALDPQLLKCIHRNAISNACKYGKHGGVIRTEVIWDRNTGILRMDVVNLPGACHDGKCIIENEGQEMRCLRISGHITLSLLHELWCMDHDDSKNLPILRVRSFL